MSTKINCQYYILIIMSCCIIHIIAWMDREKNTSKLLKIGFGKSNNLKWVIHMKKKLQRNKITVYNSLVAKVKAWNQFTSEKKEAVSEAILASFVKDFRLAAATFLFITLLHIQKFDDSL